MALNNLGLIKTTLLDFPGRLAATIFTPGCNLRCPWCHNPELVYNLPDAQLLPRAEVLAILTSRRSVLEGVVVTGGEPLLHEDVPALLEDLKDLGYAVKLDTNGTFPDRLAGLSEGLVDFVAMDLKTAPSRYHLQGARGMGPRVRRSIQMIQDHYPERQFRTTWVPGLNQWDEIPEMARALGHGEHLSITGFRSGKTLDPTWRHRRSATPDELLSVAAAFRAEGIVATVGGEDEILSGPPG